MRNKRGLNNILSTDRKTLYIILSIVMVSVLTLTVKKIGSGHVL